MQNLWRRAALAFALALTAAFVAAGEPEKPTGQAIRFEKGHTSATVRGTMRIVGRYEENGPKYRVRAAAGQTMTIRFKGAELGASYYVFCPRGGGVEAEPPEASVLLPESGEYDIQLHAHTEKAAEVPYEVEVAVTGKPHPVTVRGVTGTYDRNEGQPGTLEVVEMPGGKLRFHFDGLWNPPGVSPDAGAAHTGTLGGTAMLRKGKAVYRESGYTMTMTFGKNNSLRIEEAGQANGFGANVTARGEYSRSSLCAGPARWKDD
jgi:hypothetical protein